MASSRKQRNASHPTGDRDLQGFGLSLLTRAASSKAIDRLGLRKPAEKAVYEASKTGFKAAAAAGRAFNSVSKPGKGTRLPSAAPRGLFDLTPSEEQQAIQEAAREFAKEQLRPAAAQADTDCAAPDTLLKRANTELGVASLAVPEAEGGFSAERSTITNVLVAEALGTGDMGLAVALLAPAAVSTALTHWGDASQQATYLPEFVGENPPAAAFAVVEPRPLFDPFALATTAKRSAGGFVLNGVKSLVPRAASAELFVIAADLDGTPALFIVESKTKGITVEAEPSMGLRAASLGRLHLKDVKLPDTALLGEGTGETYADAIRLSRIGWAALACGTSQAVLDYVIPYVNEREAFGEPISHRQAVAFMVANIGIELEGMRLVTYKAASRAEQGKDFSRESALARKLTAEYGMKIGNDGVQLLGGHGFVKEHPVERWYRDLRAIGVMEGAVLV